MTGIILAAVLSQADAGAPFVPVVLNVHHGEVFLTDDARDGGFDPAPTLIPAGVFMDDATASWVAQNKASWRAQATVGPSWSIVFYVAGLSALAGLLFGAWGMWEFVKVVR